MALALTAALPAVAAGLTPYRAIYDLTYGGVTIGEAVYELRIDGNGNVLFNARAEPRGVAAFFSSDIVSEQSRLRLDDGVLVALRYDYRQERNRRSLEQKSIEFDWQTGRALTQVNGERQQIVVDDGVVDRMSLQLRVMQDRLTGNDDTALVYQVVEDHELREYAFEVRERAHITTEAGAYDAVRLERQHGSRTTIFWSAPALGYLPVRIEQRRTGQPTSRMDLRTIDIGPRS